MTWFSNEVANTLQYFTFPLEGVGLTLAMIEVRYPTLARAIADRIAGLAARNRQQRNRGESRHKAVVAHLRSFRIVEAVFESFRPTDRFEQVLFWASVAVALSLLGFQIHDILVSSTSAPDHWAFALSYITLAVILLLAVVVMPTPCLVSSDLAIRRRGHG